MFGWGKKNKEEEKAATAVKTAEKPKEQPAKAKAAEKAKPPVEKKPAPAKIEAKPAKKEEHDHEHELKVKVLSREGCRASLSVQVSVERVEEAVEESLQNISGRVKMPGFRPGKAPLEMVRKSYSDAAREQALDYLLRESVYLALQQEKLDAVTTPSVDKIEYETGKPFKFELKVEVAPKIVLKDYKGLALTKKVKTFADADVDKKVEELREANAKLAPSASGVVGEKDFVEVNYEGFLDGKPVPGGKADGQLIEMGAPQTLAGFTEGLKGAKAGESRDISVKFPDDHPNKELAGKTVVFKAVVNAVKEKQLPAADDEFAKDLGCENLADLRDRLRKNMEAEWTRGQRQTLERQASDRLIEAHVFDVPPSLVEERAKHLTEQLKQYLTRQGASEEDWKANEAKMNEKNKAEAERQVRLSYLLAGVREAEKVEVSDSELDETVNKSVESVEPARREEMRKWMKDRRDHVRGQMVEEKIFNLLIDNAKVTEENA